MYRTVLLILLMIPGAGIFLTANGQDKIITVSDDTIHCKINRVAANAIHFTQFSGVVKTRSSISKKDVRSWQVNETEKFEITETTGDLQNGRWRFSMNGGMGYRLAGTKETRKNLQGQGVSPSEIDSYLKQVKTGVKASGQAHYMFWKNYGLGIDYQFHTSSGSLYNTVDPGDGFTLVYGKFNDDIFTNYLGLSLYMQHWLNPKFKFFGQISSGLTMFRQESVIIYSPLLITGKAYGGNTELGLEYFIGKKVAVVLSAGLFQSTISKITVNNGTAIQDIKLQKEQMEGLSRLDLNAGLRFFL